MKLEFERHIALPAPTLFSFGANPANLALLHEGLAPVRLIRHDGAVTPGRQTWVEAAVAGFLPIAMGFEHFLYEPPLRFGDRMIHGPFKRFEHVHEFAPVEDGTLMRDHLQVELPWWYGGDLAMRLLVAPMMRRMFRQRGEAMVRLARSGAIEAAVKAP